MKRSKNNTPEGKTPIWKHVVILLLSPLALPIIAILLLYSKCKGLYYKDRPKPVPKRLRKYLKTDCVIDENNNTVSLAEYKYKHGTSYGLDDVYGKKYLATLSKEEKEAILDESANYGTLKILKNIPHTPYTTAATALGRGIVEGDFTEFENMLSDYAVHVNYRKETISGKSKVLEYWKGWRSRHVVTKNVKKFEVVHSNYYSHACLLLGNMIVMFIIHDGKITKTLLIQRFLNGMIGHHDDLLDFPFDLDSIKPCLTKIKDPSEVDEDETTENRIPCLACGTPSEELEWYSSLFEAGYHGYMGLVSVCPHCHKVVEYYPRIRTRYIEPVEHGTAKLPIPHRHHKKEYNPRIFGIRNFENSDPLDGTNYVEGLSGKIKIAAEKSDWGMIHMMGQQELDKVKGCYQKALEDGLYEAANNLGIIVSNFEGNTKEGIKFFKRAMDGGSRHAMLNLFTVLWCDKRYQDAVDLLAQVRENCSPSLKCLWNLAFFHFMGEDYPHNPIKQKSPDNAKMILGEILNKQEDPLYNEDKDIFSVSKDFLEYIDKGNILSSKAKDYHWRIKANPDSLVAKGQDTVFYELDALSLDEGLHMSLRFADPKRKGTGSCYYVFNNKDEENKDILKYLHVRESPMGIWQIYLLITTPMIAPIGCGADDERTFILTGDELYDIEPINNYDLSELTRQDFLYPSVHIEKESDGVTGHVFCCYWSNHEGLIREEIKIRLLNGKVDSFEIVDKFVLYEYNVM